jgi:2-polyprenyl-6-methoxyphenol hydroxylase-like FAD-dependent oxidoreductase
MTKTVLVAGAGPVGLTMACELARYGVAVRIIDKAAQRTDKSKALVLWSRTLELLDRGGGSAQFIDVAHDLATGENVYGIDLDAGIDMGSEETPYPYALMLPQTDTERLLDERLQSLGVSVERQVGL